MSTQPWWSGLPSQVEELTLPERTGSIATVIMLARSPLRLPLLLLLLLGGGAAGPRGVEGQQLTLTAKAMEAYEAARDAAARGRHTTCEAGHVFQALIADASGFSWRVLKRGGGDPAAVASALRAEVRFSSGFTTSVPRLSSNHEESASLHDEESPPTQPQKVAQSCPMLRKLSRAPRGSSVTRAIS